MSLYSKDVPDYITEGLLERQMAKRAKFEQKPIADFAKLRATGMMKTAQFTDNVSFVDHGFGVREAKDNGTIWFVEGDYIRRQEDKDLQVVLNAMEREKKNER